MVEKDNVVRFVAEQFRRLNLRFDRFEERFDNIEARLPNIERRLTDSSHFDQSMPAHTASVYASIDTIKADRHG